VGAKAGVCVLGRGARGVITRRDSCYRSGCILGGLRRGEQGEGGLLFLGVGVVVGVGGGASLLLAGTGPTGGEGDVGGRCERWGAGGVGGFGGWSNGWKQAWC